MRTNKDGTPDKRFKKEDKTISEYTLEMGQQMAENSDPLQRRNGRFINISSVDKEAPIEVHGEGDWDIKVHDPVHTDPNELHERLLKEHNLQLDFDVVEGTISTKFGFIKLDKPTLVVKVTYGKQGE
jgi:hypothetical protein